MAAKAGPRAFMIDQKLPYRAVSSASAASLMVRIVSCFWVYVCVRERGNVQLLTYTHTYICLKLLGEDVEEQGKISGGQI